MPKLLTLCPSMLDIMCFRQGLNSKLQDHMVMFKFNTFSELVNGAIIQDDAHLAHKAEKKRHQLCCLLAAPQRGSVIYSLVHSEPHISTSLCTATPDRVQATSAATTTGGS